MNVKMYTPFGFAVLMLFALFAVSCASVRGKNYKDMNSFMYGMIYNSEGTPVPQVEVYVNNILCAYSDVQGRFILKFNEPVKIKADRSPYTISLVKDGYESVSASMIYDPMGLLHFNMRTAADLLKAAEQALSTGEYEQAQEVLVIAARISPDAADIRYMQALVYYKNSQYTRALDLLHTIHTPDEKTQMIINTTIKNIEKHTEAAMKNTRRLP